MFVWILVKIGDQVFRAVLDTGATLSIVARRLLKTFKKTKTVAIRVGDGRTIHSLGDVDVTVCLGDETVTQHCRDTDAFDIVIGTDFLRRKPQVKMFLQRPYSLHCDFGSGRFSVPLELSRRKESGLRYAAKTNYPPENYQLARHVLENGLAALRVTLDEIQVELFASQQQHIMQFFCSKHLNNAFRFFWKAMGLAYANPPFSHPHARPRPATPPRHYPGAATTNASATPPLPPTTRRQHPPDRRPGNREPGGRRTHREPRAQQPSNPRPPRHPRPHQHRHQHTATPTHSTPATPPPPKKKTKQNKPAKREEQGKGRGRDRGESRRQTRRPTHAPPPPPPANPNPHVPHPPRKRQAQGHTGEQEASGPGHRTSEAKDGAGAPVKRSQAAQGTAHAKQHTEQAHR